MAREKKKEVGIKGTYRTMYSYTCPVRGLITQEIEVKVFNSPEVPEHENTELQELKDLLELYDDRGIDEELN